MDVIYLVRDKNNRCICGVYKDKSRAEDYMKVYDSECEFLGKENTLKIDMFYYDDETSVVKVTPNTFQEKY